MVRSSVFFGLLLGALSTASAQTPSARYEIFAGYSYLPADLNDFPRTNSSGLHVGASGRVGKWTNLVAELGMHFSDASNLGPNFAGVRAKTSVYEFLAGPRFTGRGPVSPFVHALVGKTTVRTNLRAFSSGGFTFALGGGVDASLAPHLSACVQLDQLGSFADVVEGNARVSAGLVLKIGKP